MKPEKGPSARGARKPRLLFKKGVKLRLVTALDCAPAGTIATVLRDCCLPGDGYVWVEWPRTVDQRDGGYYPDRFELPSVKPRAAPPRASRTRGEGRR